jgi:putative glutamine amidotransferase
MSTKPLIGIPCYQDILPPTQRPRFWMYQTYARALEAAGALPVLIPLLDADTVGALFDRMDGILLAGGDDVNPARFQQPPHPKTEAPDDRRDQVEIDFAVRAVDAGKPLLAICRGMQVLNVALGGSLLQHIPEQVPNHVQHEFNYDDYHLRHNITHEVDIVPGTRLASILDAPKVGVNSFHHQALDQVARGLQVVACASDGVVEAVERPGPQFVLGVQWHPEDMFHENSQMLSLFEKFIEYVQTH